MFSSNRINGNYRFIFNSYIVSYFAIEIFYDDFKIYSLYNNEIFNYNSTNVWFERGNEFKFDKRFNAFYNNIATLVHAIKSSGVKVILMNDVFNTEDKSSFYLEILEEEGVYRNQNYLELISKEINVPFCKLEFDEFKDSHFIEGDILHTNELGEKLKAKKLLPYIIHLLD